MHNRLHNHFSTKQAVGSARSSTVAIHEADGNFERRGNKIAQRATRSLALHPAVAIGAAFAVGLLVGKWVKR